LLTAFLISLFQGSTNEVTVPAHTLTVSVYLHHNPTTSYKQKETSHINMLFLPFLLAQALYKLYSVAANHRQLYNHAFPGHQTGQPPEQDKKQNWPHTVSRRCTVDSDSGRKREKEARDCLLLQQEHIVTITHHCNILHLQLRPTVRRWQESDWRQRFSLLRLKSKITVLVLNHNFTIFSL